MRRMLIGLLKVGLSLGIVAWLFGRAMQGEAFDRLHAQMTGPGFHWGLLAAAFVCLLAAVVITFVRWCYLVRALDIPFTMREALRLGFLGFLFNLAPMGIIGGDLLKAVVLARQRPGRRAGAVASVVVDRVIGLYILFVVAAAAIGLSGFYRHDDPQVRSIAVTTLLGTLAATLVLAAVFIPGATQGRLSSALGRLPYVGRQLGQLIEAVRLYRNNAGVLAGASLLTIAVHSLTTFGIYWITLGIYNGGGKAIDLMSEFVVVPLASATGVIPLVMGPMELVIDYLYVRVFALEWGQGLVVALGYRIISLLVALVGVAFYLGAREELREAMSDDTADESPTVETTTSFRQRAGSHAAAA